MEGEKMNNSGMQLERKILLNRLEKKNLIPENGLDYIRYHNFSDDSIFWARNKGYITDSLQFLLLFPEESVRYALVDDDTNRIIGLFNSEEGVKKAFDDVCINISNRVRWEEF